MDGGGIGIGIGKGRWRDVGEQIEVKSRFVGVEKNQEWWGVV